jgi:hypothetical protein
MPKVLKDLVNEPVLVLALLSAGLSVGVSLGLHLTKTQDAAVVTAATAAFGLLAAFRTRPWNVTLITTTFAAGLVAVVGFGHFGTLDALLTPATIGTLAAFLGTILALVLRTHVSPVTGPAYTADGWPQRHLHKEISRHVDTEKENT